MYSGSVEVVSTLNPGTKPEGTPIYPSYDNLVMAGYQGWFSVKGDDSGNNGYVHCGRDGKFEPGYAGIEFWPDMTEYTKKYPVDFVYPDNSQAYFFSSSDEETVDLHFKRNRWRFHSEIHIFHNKSSNRKSFETCRKSSKKI